MIYVALLRGINVGGNAKVEMPKLKTCFETLGCKDVLTYINSGNVIFRDDRPAQELVPLIEAAIAKDFRLNIHVVLRDIDNFKLLCQKIPLEWTNDDRLKTDVMFLWDEIDNPDILEKVTINPKIEYARYYPGALVWHISRTNTVPGGSITFGKAGLSRRMTARNINTVRKLFSLMQKLEDKLEKI